MTAPDDLLTFKRLIEKRNPDFSKSQKKIASFLLSDHDHAAFMNAAELAARLDVSEATVVRFASAIGFDGFPQLRKFLQNMLRDKVSPALRMQNKLEDLRHGEGHILSQVVEMETKSISEISHTVHQKDFDAALSILLGAERVFIFGIGPSRMLAELMELRLNRFGIPTVALVESGRDILEKLLLLKPTDAVIATAFNRLTGELLAVLKHAKLVDCPRVLITDISDPDLFSYVHTVLAVKRGPIHSFHSLTAPMTVINALILAIAMAKPDESLKSLAELEEFRKEYDLDPIGTL
jgi:DNA-binding MurR/RpiR family transcriptional regulator